MLFHSLFSVLMTMVLMKKDKVFFSYCSNSLKELNILFEFFVFSVLVFAISYYYSLKDTYREKAPSNKTPALTKSKNMDICVVGTSNELKQIFQKTKVVTGKTLFFVMVHFILPVLFVSTLTFDRAVLYGNITFSILVLSTKRRSSIFWEKLFVFQNICLKVKVLKTFKISSASYFSVGFKVKPPRKSVLPC